jgi:hypothetical protein
MIAQAQMQHSTSGSSLADILERVLDKGIVIAGDIKIKLVDIELLTIQIRLIIASVDKAKELGMDWWMLNPALSSKAARPEPDSEVAELKRRLAKLETRDASATVTPADQVLNT